MALPYLSTLSRKRHDFKEEVIEHRMFFNRCTVHFDNDKIYFYEHGTQYTHHNLKHMLPQHCKTYNDVLLLINSIKV
jgi:hypothetical protein